MSKVFVPMHTKLLNRTIFTNYYSNIIEIINYYGLRNLIYCIHSINIDLCAKFYNNSVKVDDLMTCRTRVGCQNIFLSFEVIRECNPSINTFHYFLFYTKPLPNTFSDITLDIIEGQRPSTVANFSATHLRVHEYILYKVITTCILPINIRDLVVMRP